MKNGKVDIWPKCPHMRTQAHKGYIYVCISFYKYIIMGARTLPDLASMEWWRSTSYAPTPGSRAPFVISSPKMLAPRSPARMRMPLCFRTTSYVPAFWVYGSGFGVLGSKFMVYGGWFKVWGARACQFHTCHISSTAEVRGARNLGQACRWRAPSPTRACPSLRSAPRTVPSTATLPFSPTLSPLV